MSKIHFLLKNKFEQNIAQLTGTKADYNNLSLIISDVEKYSLLVDEPIHKDFINHFLMFIENEYQSYSILSTLWVAEDARGKGLGKEMVEKFNIENKDTEITFLFTRNKAKQREMFNLETFYNDLGFVTIYETELESWMIRNSEFEKYMDFFS